MYKNTSQMATRCSREYGNDMVWSFICLLAFYDPHVKTVAETNETLRTFILEMMPKSCCLSIRQNNPV